MTPPTPVDLLKTVKPRFLELRDQAGASNDRGWLHRAGTYLWQSSHLCSNAQDVTNNTKLLIKLIGNKKSGFRAFKEAAEPLLLIQSQRYHARACVSTAVELESKGELRQAREMFQRVKVVFPALISPWVELHLAQLTHCLASSAGDLNTVAEHLAAALTVRIGPNNPNNPLRYLNTYVYVSDYTLSLSLCVCCRRRVHWSSRSPGDRDKPSVGHGANVSTPSITLITLVTLVTLAPVVVHHPRHHRHRPRLLRIFRSRCQRGIQKLLGITLITLTTQEGLSWI